MAARQSATQVTARQRARQLAAAFQEREATLLSLAGEYFVTAATLETIAERAERDIEKIRERAEADGQSARIEAESIVRKMLDRNATRSEVAERLGITVRELPKLGSVLSDASAGDMAPAPKDHADGNDDALTEIKLEAVGPEHMRDAEQRWADPDSQHADGDVVRAAGTVYA